MEKLLTCKIHGETSFTYTGGRWRCKKCLVDWDRNKRHKIKQKLVDLKGGKCEICGYDKCLNALEFHHVDRETKLFELNLANFNKAFDILKIEVNKCVLVCSNCHRELHYHENEDRRKRFIMEHKGVKSNAIDKLDYDKILADFNNGLYQQEIAEKYNTSLSTVKRFMQKHNISRKHIKITKEQILTYCKENATYTYISEKTGYSVSAIKKYCIKNNLIYDINTFRKKQNLPLLKDKIKN